MQIKAPSWHVIKWIVGVFAGLAVIGGIIGALIVSLGLVTISARPPHNALTRTILHYTFKRSTANAGGSVDVPADLDSPARVALGIQHYANVCSSCHGGPELGQSPVALSMRPRPQHLASVVGEFSDEQLFVILRDGVRFSAMPAWPASQNFDEIWSVVAFLRALPDMTNAEYVAATQRALPEDAPELAFDAPDQLSGLDVGIKAPPMDEYLYATPGTGWHEYASNGDVIATCAACHGAKGSGDATAGQAPNLTVPSAAYMTKALREYANGTRPSGIMTTVAASLTDAQIKGLSEYYASLPDIAPPRDQAALGDPVAGEIIATAGLPDQALPACYTCHQNVSEAAGMLIPPIAGQSAAYVRHRLDAFAEPYWTGAGTSAWQPMHWIAKSLNPQQRADLAAYFAQQAPGGRAPVATLQPMDAANARQLVEGVCKECHTVEGVGGPSGEYPNLTVQTATYLDLQLHAFRSGNREAERMRQVAEKLSDKDMSDLAQYFGTPAALPSPTPQDVFATAEEIAVGGEIASNGIPDKNIPACLSCHGPEPTSALPIIARLQGQAPRYIQDRLQALGSEKSADLDTISPMHAIARDMTVDERHDVAAWFAAQAPLPK
ncbi:Cytochrome c553 [Loktanella atrilutea]|uniref:Cytochrome c553 n=1 Tax=Loktanella atrilutea TaxID=366533 RepID=A0A1M5E2K3_LOKAT|nr:c-type cytochrome [Loktanella atrilutea]SHF73498.1 Cytochrome c553 [Loktanella atrilutea]